MEGRDDIFEDYQGPNPDGSYDEDIPGGCFPEWNKAAVEKKGKDDADSAVAHGGNGGVAFLSWCGGSQ